MEKALQVALEQILLLIQSSEQPVRTTRMRGGPSGTGGVKKAPHSPPSAGAVVMGWCFQMLCPPRHVHPHETSFPKRWFRKMLRAHRTGAGRFWKALSFPACLPAYTHHHRQLQLPKVSPWQLLLLLTIVFFLGTGSDGLLPGGPPVNHTSTSCPGVAPLPESGLGL